MMVPRKMRDIVLCVVLLGLPLLFLQANLKAPDQASAIDRLILRVSAPIQGAVTAVVGGVHRTWRRYIYLVGLQEGNEQLFSENMLLKRQLREAQRQLRRLANYEKLLKFRAASGIETIGARVIGRGVSPFARTLRLRLDRGRSSALRTGLPVVTAEGIVGRVSKVYGSYSEVRLAVDPKSAIAVIVERTGGRGILRGKDAQNRYRCGVDYLLRKDEVKVGDRVVTNGSAGVFPRGLPVGRISKVLRKSFGLYQQVEVSPAVDFGALEDVLLVLKSPPPEAARDDEPRKAQGVGP